MKNNTKIINLFGSSGAGKSTIAAGVFHLMKLNGFSVEIVTEFAKECVYECPETLKDQFYVTAMQTRRINKLLGKVDFIVSDSPILLGEVYKSNKSFLKEDFYIDLFNQYNNINYILNRRFPYIQYGRVHTELEALENDKKIRRILNKNGINYREIESDANAHNVIFNLINKEFKNDKIVGFKN